KTTFALQFLLEGAARGEAGLYLTLSETRDELFSVAESHGFDLSKLAILELSAVEQMLGDVKENTFFHPSVIELKKTADLLINEIQRVKPKRVVIDSLSEFRLLAEAPLRYRREILRLKQFFAGHSCTVLLLDDQSAEASDLHVQSIAHGVISLLRLPLSYGTQRRQLQVNKLRGVKFREGVHDFIIAKGGLRVFPRLVAGEHARDYKVEPVTSGIPEFDALLGGGLDRGTSTLLLGPAGAGKSTLAMQHAVAAASRGERSIVCIFDENKQTLARRNASLQIEAQRYISEGLIKVVQIDPAELSPGELSSILRGAVEDFGARVAIIDSLNGYLKAMPDERFMSLQLHELLTYLSQHGVMSIMTIAQHGLVGSMQSPVDVTYLADTVVLLRFFEAQGRIKKAISVVKKRTGMHEATIREFYVNERGVNIGPALTTFRGVLTGTPVFTGEEGEAFVSEKDDV
ncbi:MAG TPA: ATPase domain-containing protein, partial [Methylomirabilota bacterium]|nr:ATPase domain-containing protein [Methylomirabilota bacterium]